MEAPVWGRKKGREIVYAYFTILMTQHHNEFGPPVFGRYWVNNRDFNEYMNL